jgi:hypothetical protein
MGFDWTSFGNGMLDGSGLTGAGNFLGVVNTGPGGLTHNPNLLGNRLGSDGKKILDTGEHVLDSGEQATKDMADAMTGITNMLKGITNMDPKKLAIGAVVIIVIMKI